MNDKFLRYDGFKDISEPGLDGKKHRFDFTTGDVSDGKIESFRVTNHISIDIGVSGTLMSVWGLTPDDATAYSGTFALNRVIASGGNPEATSYVYTTDNAPERLPDKMNVNSFNQFIKLEPDTADPSELTVTHASLAAKDISGLRDNINALFKNLTGEKLLKLESERSLVDIYYPADTLETFTSRLSALANLATLLNSDFLKKDMGEKNFKPGGSIFILEQYFQCNRINQALIDEICKPLFNINNLRQGYPTHHDVADKVIPAHDYFGLRYPITDFSAAWEIIIGKYLSSLKAFLSVVQKLKYEK